jgi:hypothetical protein
LLLLFCFPFAFIIMTQAALRPLFEVRRFGSSHREPATSEVGIFGQRAWCANGTIIENDSSFKGLYEQQFGVPVFQCTNIGTPEFDSSSWNHIDLVGCHSCLQSIVLQ